MAKRSLENTERGALYLKLFNANQRKDIITYVQKYQGTASMLPDSSADLDQLPEMFAILDEERCTSMADAFHMALTMAAMMFSAFKTPADAVTYKNILSSAFSLDPGFAEKLAAPLNTLDKIDSWTGWMKTKVAAGLDKIVPFWHFTQDAKFDTDVLYEWLMLGEVIHNLFKRARLMGQSIYLSSGGFLTDYASGAQTGDPETGDYAGQILSMARSLPYREEELGDPLSMILKNSADVLNRQSKAIEKAADTLANQKRVVFMNKGRIDTGWVDVNKKSESQDSTNQGGDPEEGDFNEVGDAIEIGGPLMERMRAKRRLRRKLMKARALAKIRKRHLKKSQRAGLDEEDFNPDAAYGAEHFGKTENFDVNEEGDGGGDFDESSSETTSSDSY